MLLLPALRNISIPWSNTSGLLNIGNKWPSKEELIKIESFKEPITPLVLELRNIIRLRGPLSVHDYMSQALHHSQHGYYQNRETKKIGEFGDFITSPEISQVFGELLALWAIMIWEDMECPVKFNLVELGPGNGILMKDMLRIANKFAAFKSAINIHMIELSEVMQNVQKSQLGCESTNGVSTNESITRTSCGIPIVWHKYLKELPSGPAIFFGHEILDAFPVHQFIRTGSQPWREKYVDVDFSTPSRLHFKFVKSPARTSALTLLMDKYKTNDIQNESSFSKIKTMKPPFKDNINSATGVVTVPDEMDTSQLKDNDKSSKDASYGPQDKSDAEDNLSNDFKDVVASKDDGETKEVSPLALSTVEELARRVADHKGAILLIDYGQKDPKGDTLRGFHKHKPYHVLSSPGMVDITADVDFGACMEIAAKNGVKVETLVTQAEFLGRMGIIARVEQILDAVEDDITAERIVKSTERLLNGDMGEKFKVLGIMHPSIKAPGFP